jgi:hypothetical protein
MSNGQDKQPSITTDMRQQILEQALGAAVQQHTPDVIRSAAATVHRLAPTNNEKSGMREIQLRNVVNGAMGATSVEEIAAFILYQMGRSTNSRLWQYGEFGKTVVEALMRNDVRNAAETAIEQVVQQMKQVAEVGEITPEEREKLYRKAHITLARLYLGYLNRLFFFAERNERDDRGSWDELIALLTLHDTAAKEDT